MIPNLAAYNNYVSQNSNFSRFAIRPSFTIDYVRAFIPVHSRSAIQTILSWTQSEQLTRVFTRNGIIHQGDVFFGKSLHNLTIRSCFADDKFFGYSLKLAHPDKAATLHLNSAIPDIIPSQVEYSLDMFTHDHHGLYDLLKSLLVLKWRGKPLDVKYETTHYLNNIRRNKSKGFRLYQKAIGGRISVRMEMVLKGKYFHRRGLSSLAECHSLRPSQVFEHLSLQYIDIRKYIKEWVKINTATPLRIPLIPA